jgi:hypothetical protein
LRNEPTYCTWENMQRRNLPRLLQFYKFTPLSSFLFQTTLLPATVLQNHGHTMFRSNGGHTDTCHLLLSTNSVFQYLCPECMRKNGISVHRQLTQDDPHLTSTGYEMGAQSCVRNQGRHVRNTFSWTNFGKIRHVKKSPKDFQKKKYIYPASILLYKTNNTQNSGKMSCERVSAGQTEK